MYPCFVNPPLDGCILVSLACGRTVSFTGPQGVDEATAALKALCNQPFEPAAGRLLICKYAKWVSEEGEAEPQAEVSCRCGRQHRTRSSTQGSFLH
jgi:hypothetical protein